MRRFFSILLPLSLVATAAYADIEGDGYYRVQNTASGRYITVLDNKGGINYSTTTADLGALETHKPFSSVVSDPASILYITKHGNEAYGPYDLAAQGTSAYAISGHYLRVRKFGNAQYYRAYASQSGVTMYLYDTSNNDDEGSVLAAGDPPATNGVRRWEWDAQPVTGAEGAYFGLKPDFAFGGKHYMSFYASFAFSFASSGMKAYYISTVDEAFGIAVLKELTGTVPGATPVLVECSAADPAHNKLTLHPADAPATSGNQLIGVYFENKWRSNRVANNPATMRVLGIGSDGQLAFVKSSADYMPRNRAYLSVPATAPAEFRLMTQADYDAFVEQQKVTLTARSYTRAYGEANPTFAYDQEGTAALGGTPQLTCAATATSPVGTYPIVITAGTVTNGQVTYVNGTLTVTPAPLTVRAADATRPYGDANPALTVTYEGFKNGETASVLTAAPTASTSATATSPVGTYAITASGGSAQNYALSYADGTLTIAPALLTVSAGHYERSEGEENPTFVLTYEGFKNGETISVLTSEPVATTEATASSPAGSYEIVVSGGSAQNYEFAYVNGTLTVVPASGVASVVGDARPVDVYDVAGRKVRSQVTSLEGLPRGLYIVGGRKVIVR